MSEAKLSVIVVSLLAGGGVALMVGAAMRDYALGAGVGGVAALVLGAPMILFASDGVKTNGGDKPKTNSSPDTKAKES